MAFFSTPGNMFFQEFVTMLEISVKMIFPELGKFKNIQKLSSTLKNLRKAYRNYNF